MSLRKPKQRCAPSTRPRSLQVDLLVHWYGKPRSRDRALREIASSSRPIPAVDGKWFIPNVGTQQAFEWALQHIWEAEIDAPEWVRQWVGEWLLTRGKELTH